MCTESLALLANAFLPPDFIHCDDNDENNNNIYLVRQGRVGSDFSAVVDGERQRFLVLMYDIEAGRVFQPIL